jgi:release factor glutamine methyltransferase
VAAALTEAAARLAPSATARRDAEFLLRHIVGLSQAELLADPGRELTGRQAQHYHAAVARRALHEPVQHIVGRQEFYGRSFVVNRLVLIPRPETEHLVEATLALPSPPGRILDVGTGSGALAVTLALELPAAAVCATDISAPALAVAAKNAEELGAAERIRFLHSNLFDALAGERFDCIVSNPPYVAAGETLEAQVREYEPASALYAGPDGLAVYRRLIPGAAAHLEPGGHLLLEIGQGQQEAVGRLLAASGFTGVRFLDDLQEIPRVAVAAR